MLSDMGFITGKGDPLSQSATAKDIIRENLLDERLREPPKLPTFLEDHERRASRVDVDVCRSFSTLTHS